MKLRTWDDYVYALLGIVIVLAVLGCSAIYSYAYFYKRAAVDSIPPRRVVQSTATTDC
jgi:hypothetical protein